MKHTVIALFVAVLLMAVRCLGEEPNAPVNSSDNSIEARLTAIEKRLDAIENRLTRLELQRIPAQPDPNRDRLRNERTIQQIEDLSNTLAVDEMRIKNMFVKTYPNTMHRLDKSDIPEIVEDLKRIKEHVSSLNRQERNYSNLLQLIEKSPNSGVDLSKVKSQYNECKRRGKQADENLKNIRTLIEYNREIFNIVPR